MSRCWKWKRDVKVMDCFVAALFAMTKLAVIARLCKSRSNPERSCIEPLFSGVVPNCKAALIVFITLFLTPPLYGQSFEALLDELSGSDADQLESELAAQQGNEIPSSLPTPSKEITASPEDELFAPEKNIETSGVVLQGLDKQTGRIFAIEVKVGEPITFGTLKLIVQHCEKTPIDDREESMAFIKISEEKPKCAPQSLFSGWMFASSPALSALDHPVYDVWVKECKKLN